MSFGICLFLQGLSGNTEERPTRRDYIEISTCRTIILHLEDSRSHGKEAEAERGQALGTVDAKVDLQTQRANTRFKR